MVTKSRVSLIGDAFGKPLGTAGAALDSAARAVADMHLSTPALRLERRQFQTSLADW